MSMQLLPVKSAVCCGPDTPVLPPDEAVELAARFKALADPTRVAILNRLARADQTCVCDLTATFDLAQPTISHHLRVLRDAGLVDVTRRGTWAFYRVVPEALTALSGAITPQ
jgi:ArsR family transcriptional regulator